MQTLRGSGREYRVIGASGQTGEDIEITVEAFDESDAARTANRQGMYVSRCVAVGPDGSGWAAARPAPAPPAAPAPAAAPATTLAQAVGGDPVVQRLVGTYPHLGSRFKRLNEHDRRFLSDLEGERIGISYRDSAHVARLMQDAGQ